MGDKALREEQEDIYGRIKAQNRSLNEQEQAQVAAAAEMQDFSYDQDHTNTNLAAQNMQVPNVLHDISGEDAEMREVKKSKKKRRDKRGMRDEGN